MLPFELSEGDWLEGLPPGQSSALNKLLSAGKTELEVAQLWLGKTGPETTFGFGGSGGIQHYFENVKKEFDAFVCGDPQYEEERKAAAEIWEKHGKVALVSSVAAVIAHAVGLAAGALVPVVALLFSLTSKIGINAYCETCA